MSTPNVEISTPTLYKLDSKGVTRVWRSWSTLNEDGSAVENNESGILDGKLSGIPITVTTGKNIGRKNETTPLQQVNKRIESKMSKKLTEGYVEQLSEYTQQGVMGALYWETRKHDMSQIALHQPKLDGIRCKVIANSDRSLTLMSRGNKEFKPYLQDTPWFSWLYRNMEAGEEVDGELYIHGLDLNEIASLVMSYKLNQEDLMVFCEETPRGLQINLKAKEILDLVYTGNFQPEPEVIRLDNGSFKVTNRLAESMGAIEVGRNKGWIFPGVTLDDVRVLGTLDLEYWIFDVPESNVMAEERNFNLKERWDSEEALSRGLVAVVAEEFNIDDIESINAEHVANGFEGTMVRLPSGYYGFGKKTSALLKYKLFYDAEWIIQGYETDREGNPTLVFVSDDGYEFKARPKGTRAWRVRLLSVLDQLIGERATIRYQTLHSETLIPQFARVLSIRNYE